METKLSAVKKQMALNNWQEAIRLASKFPQLGNHRAAILDANLAYTNPRFMLQIKKDLVALKENGRIVLLQKYSIPD
jgi:hypothetical protein